MSSQEMLFTLVFAICNFFVGRWSKQSAGAESAMEHWQLLRQTNPDEFNSRLGSLCDTFVRAIYNAPKCTKNESKVLLAYVFEAGVPEQSLVSDADLALRSALYTQLRAVSLFYKNGASQALFIHAVCIYFVLHVNSNNKRVTG